MKYKIVRKKLLAESMALCGGLVVLGAVLFFLLAWNDDMEQSNRNLQTELTSLKNEMQSLDGKYTNWRQNNALYEEALKKSETGQLSINRSMIRDLFAGYNNRYMLRNVSLQMQPVQPISLPAYNRQNYNMVYSQVTVKLDALTDLDVFELMHAMHRDFPGKLKILSVDLIKKNGLTKETATEIATKGIVNMVSATVQFLWVGMVAAEDMNGGANAPKP